MNSQVNICGCTGELNNKGLYIYKADPNIKPFKLNGALKKVQRDKPAFKAIIQAEKAIIQDYEQLLVNSVKDIAHILTTFGK